MNYHIYNGKRQMFSEYLIFRKSISPVFQREERKRFRFIQGKGIRHFCTVQSEHDQGNLQNLI